jgi:hypothetical protein
MKAAKGKAKAAAATLAAVGGAAKSPASTPRVPAKPAARAQTAYQRKLELVTNALKAQGSTFSLQLSFGSAAADLVCVNASLDDTSVDDCAEVLASLLTDVTVGDKSEREQLEQALEDAAEDYEAAAAEAAAKRRVEQLGAVEGRGLLVCACFIYGCWVCVHYSRLLDGERVTAGAPAAGALVMSDRVRAPPVPFSRPLLSLATSISPCTR